MWVEPSGVILQGVANMQEMSLLDGYCWPRSIVSWQRLLHRGGSEFVSDYVLLQRRLRNSLTAACKRQGKDDKLVASKLSANDLPWCQNLN
jgi:hypothetical protein